MEDSNIPELHIPAEKHSLTSHINSHLKKLDLDIRVRETLKKWKSNLVPDYHVLPYALSKYPVLTSDNDVQVPFLLNTVVGVVDDHNVVLALAVSTNEERKRLDSEIQFRHLSNDTYYEAQNEGNVPSLVKEGLMNQNLGVLLAYAGEVGDTVYDMIEDFKVVRGFPVPTSPELAALKVVHAQPNSHSLIVGLDPYSMKPKLFVVDPGGRLGAFRTYSIGRNWKKMNDFLSTHEGHYLSKGKECIENQDYMDGPVRLAIRALVEVANSRGEKIEVSVITPSKGLKQLDQVTIENIIQKVLKRIAKRKKSDTPLTSHATTATQVASPSPSPSRATTHSEVTSEPASPSRTATQTAPVASPPPASPSRAVPPSRVASVPSSPSWTSTEEPGVTSEPASSSRTTTQTAPVASPPPASPSCAALPSRVASVPSSPSWTSTEEPGVTSEPASPSHTATQTAPVASPPPASPSRVAPESRVASVPSSPSWTSTEEPGVTSEPASPSRTATQIAPVASPPPASPSRVAPESRVASVPSSPSWTSTEEPGVGCFVILRLFLRRFGC